MQRLITGGFRNFVVSGVFACLIVLANQSIQASTIIIDDFSRPNPDLFFALGSGNSPKRALTQPISPTGHTIGDQRDSLFEVFGTAQSNSIVGLLGHDNSFNIDAFQVGTNGPSPSVQTLQYSGTNTQNTSTSLVNAHNLGGGLGVDLTGGGTNDRFQFLFYSSDALPTSGLDLSATVTSPGGKSSTGSIIVPNNVPSPPSTYTVDFLFNQLSGNVDLTHVDSIRFVFNGGLHTPNIDFELHSIVTTTTIVPEPTGAILAFIGGAVICVFGRVRKTRTNKHLV